MGSESDVFVVLTAYSDDSLVAAKELLDLADFAGGESQVAAAASAAVIAALAHLERATAVTLVGDFANQAAGAGRVFTEDDARRYLKDGFARRLHQLVELRWGPGVELDRRRPWARLLLGAIRRRNDLVHEGKVFLSGKPSEVGAELPDGRVVIPFSPPARLWHATTREYALDVVAAVEAFLVGVVEAGYRDRPLDERLFSREGDRSWRARSGRGRFGIDS